MRDPSSRTRLVIYTSIRPKQFSNLNGRNNKISDIAWSSNVNYTRSYDSRFRQLQFGQTTDHKKEQKKKLTASIRKCCWNKYCFLCSLLSTLLILLGIAALLVGILMKHKTTTTITTTSSTTTTTTTTTAYVCATTCLNQTWQSVSNLIAQWLFDLNFQDQRNTYNATSINNVLFTNNGYVRQAAVFSLGTNQMLTAPYIPLASTSFTVETWIYITGLSNLLDQSIFGLCSALASYQCLHITIRQSASSFYLYFGFYGADCQGITPVSLNTWIHVAVVFDITVIEQYVYFDGVLDNNCVRSQSLQATNGTVTIGYIPGIAAATSPNNYFQGYIDQLTVSLRAKSACEILEDATLSARFTFDTGLLLIDSGPNNLPATAQSISSTPTGHVSQALTLSGSSSSYFQISDVTSLGISNRSFSISLWIRPVSLSGVLVHVSRSALGGGGGSWCIPFLGFSNNGSLVAEVYNTNGVISILDPFLSISTATWSHIVQTWSSTNGLRLYINNILVASRTSQATTYTASGISNYVTLGNVLNGTGCARSLMGALTPYQGDMDDFRVYSRELTAADVCELYVV